MAYNPRFPHTLHVLRPVLDENGDIIFDENGDPTYRTLPLEKVVLDGSDEEIGDPVRDLDGNFLTETVETISWGYRTSTGGFRDSGDVSEADYKIATPMFLTPLETGDVVMMKDYDREREMEVLKKTTYNWGANIWVKDVKN